jgi:hypothetical protein
MVLISIPEKSVAPSPVEESKILEASTTIVGARYLFFAGKLDLLARLSESN